MLHGGKRQSLDSLLCVTKDVVNGFALGYTLRINRGIVFISTLPTHSLQIARHCQHRISLWTLSFSEQHNYPP